ncbi:MAG TPA: PAS domain S-box protein [Chromatiaceae bacterium]|nr:PAS domain S-box protein [Chromatiaceae bacterium]
MKQHITPTRTERLMQKDDFIVSKTDTRGRIRYCNRIFMEISGYTEQELLGRQHNIVRHPDMPRSVFDLLWRTLREGQEFFGYIKNLAKDGSYYWTFANVSPSLDSDARLIGYYSVRRAPERAAIEQIAPVYARMIEAEREAGAKAAISASRVILNDFLDQRAASYEHYVLAV